MGKLISVLVPVFNAEDTILSCVHSILNQNYSNFELLLYFDGTTDKSMDLVTSIGDNRIQCFINTENIGIAAARNHLALKAKGDFVAWMDADDFMLPNRLTLQLNYLLGNKSIDICGTAALLRNYHLKEKVFLAGHDNIHACQFFKSCTLMPTLMTRNFYSEENGAYLFDEGFGSRASDYEWIYRIGNRKRIENLAVPTVSYYVSSTENLLKKQTENDFENKMLGLMDQKFKLFHLDYPKDELLLLHRFILSNFKLKKEEGEKIERMIWSILEANEVFKIHSTRSMKFVVLFQLLRLYKNSGSIWTQWPSLVKVFGLGLCFKLLIHKRTLP